MKRRWIPRPCKGIEETKEHESDDYTNCNWCSSYSYQRVVTRIGGLGNKKTSRNHPNKSIIEISQNSEKSPGVSRRLAITQTHGNDYQLTVVWKTQGVNNNWKKNNCIDISSEKLARLHTGRPGHGNEAVTLRQKLIFFSNISTKNALRVNYMKAKIDNTQQNRKCL